MAFFQAALAQDLEGIVAKKGASRYREGVRAPDWIKVKTHRRQEAVIGGYTRGTLGVPPKPGERRYYIFSYDWRQDNIEAARGLDRLIEAIRREPIRSACDLIVHDRICPCNKVHHRRISQLVAASARYASARTRQAA